MEIKTLSKKALEVIEQYTNFKLGQASCSVPYFNNRTTKKRASLRTFIGKGSPLDIKDELEIILVNKKINKDTLSNDSLKKILVDNELGIECSGFVYHVLEAESLSRDLGTISKQLNFINCHGFFGQLKCLIRPVENCDVTTFSDDTNSISVALKNALPGDIITMTDDENSKERNHILIIKDIQYENNIPSKITYVHSIAYPEDGVYGTGVRQGHIEINNIDLPLTEQNWTEGNMLNQSNLLLNRAKRSKTSLKRLKFFSSL